jgi:dethiobiotin synthetase
MTLRGVFVAGTDTGVGKTFVSTGLARAAVADGRRLAVMKPVAAGADATPAGLRNDDALALIDAARSTAAYEDVNPYCLPLAASPHIAAAAAGLRIEPAVVQRAADRLAAAGEWLLVEGAGGWFAPIGERETMADVARALGLPVLLVVGLRLGCLIHALLTHEAFRRDGLRFAGWIGNAIDPGLAHADANLDWLRQRFGEPFALVPWQGGGAASGEDAATLLTTASRRVMQL